MYIKLSTKDKIEFHRVNDSWVAMKLVTNHNEYELGAETPYYIVQKLRDAFNNYSKIEASGKINGTKLIWILSLSEKHYSLYLGKVNGKYVIYFQNAEGKNVESIEINEEVFQQLSVLNEDEISAKA